MESYTRFSTTEKFQEYVSKVDQLALTDDTEKVHLKEGRVFEYVVHAYYTIPTIETGNDDSWKRILGESCDLTKVAKIKITYENGEFVYINPARTYDFTRTGDYTVEYGLYDYTNGLSNFLVSCKNLRYVQIDPSITQCRSSFIQNCSNLEGVIFGELDDYPEEKVFEEDYSREDIIIGDHVTYIDEKFVLGCPKIRNIYIGKNATKVCIFSSDKYGSTYANLTTQYRSKLYIGKSVNDLHVFNQNKIWTYIVDPDNQTYLYDETTKCLISKADYENSGIKNILIGCQGLDDTGYWYCPSGYKISSYAAFRGMTGLRVINLKDYDYISPYAEYRTLENVVVFPGFIDCSGVELIVMPKNVKFINRFSGGTIKANLIFYTPEPPIVDWGGDWDKFPGSPGKKFGYSFLGSGDNNTGVSLSSGLNIYVLEGTEEQKDKWTAPYDDSYTDLDYKNTYGTNSYWGNERPNRWKAALTDPTDIPLGEQGQYYNGMNLQFKTEQELDELVQQFIEQEVRWVDPEFKRVALETFNNGEEMTQEQLSAITDNDFYSQFSLRNNTEVKSMLDLYKFTSVRRIPPYCFENCTSLGLLDSSKFVSNNPVTLIRPIRGIGTRAFSGCNNVKTIYIDTDTWYGTSTGQGWNKNTDPEGPQSFGGMTKLKGTVSIATFWQDGNTYGQEYNGMGSEESGVKLIHLPRYGTYGSWFKDSKILGLARTAGELEIGKLKIPSDVVTIKKEAFGGTTGALVPNLEIIIPSSTTTIQSAFGGSRAATKFKSLDLGENVSSITGPVLENNVSSYTIICRATTPPTLGLGGIGQNINNSELQFPFMNSSNLTAIYVPDDSVDLYKNNSNIVVACDFNAADYSTSSEQEIGWKRFSSIIRPLSELN